MRLSQEWSAVFCAVRLAAVGVETEGALTGKGESGTEALIA
jgi:hypothetical protein